MLQPVQLVQNRATLWLHFSGTSSSKSTLNHDYGGLERQSRKFQFRQYFGLGCWNERREMLSTIYKTKICTVWIVSFFQKQARRKWTRKSPDDCRKNEIDYIRSDKTYIALRFSTSSTRTATTGRKSKKWLHLSLSNFFMLVNKNNSGAQDICNTWTCSSSSKLGWEITSLAPTINDVKTRFSMK